MNDIELMPNTRKYALCLNFIKSNAMTPEDYIERFGMSGYRKEYNLIGDLDELVMSGFMRMFKDKYYATPKLKSYIKLDDIEYVKPIYIKPFEPLNPSKYLPKVSPRGQQLREFCHIGLSNGAKEEESTNLSIRDEGLPFVQKEQVGNSVSE